LAGAFEHLWCDLVGSVLAYVFYWLAVIVALVWMKFSEVSFDVQQKKSRELSLMFSDVGTHQAFWMGVCCRKAQTRGGGDGCRGGCYGGAK
jgi:hypothetical protein